MNNFNIIRLEINYFLSSINSTLGTKDKSLAEEAISELINNFFFPTTTTLCTQHIDLLEGYIKIISAMNIIEYRNIKKNVPTIIQLISIIKQEQFCHK
ncbi:hypothetical protein BD780_003472 [Clostridium tetanomorphum]|uniref:hypothetical protein n=1 Tax=Clostridium tetanomorphum TaxID=1553 RepID=UPI00054EF053|nr:hypothetical protein [Clostridium tetanomorphum]MBP1863671.1 hypothetical protein [Clostridium tetanomorphum]NRS86247.1 hypothetical protein [Clostridium tetanomorphum]SQC00746.1 Uncharacterised protein [Clostridium tetanomorphum]